MNERKPCEVCGAKDTALLRICGFAYWLCPRHVAGMCAGKSLHDMILEEEGDRMIADLNDMDIQKESGD